MITIEEAEADFDAQRAREEAEEERLEKASDSSGEHERPGYLHKQPRALPNRLVSAKVIAKLPSFRIAKDKPLAPRDPSFFKRMFSSKKLNRVADEDDSLEGSEQTEEGHDSVDDGHQDEDDDGDDLEALPPMPNLGKPVNMELLNRRNEHAVQSMEILMSMVNEDVKTSIRAAQNIPVGADYDRASVTPEISKAIAKVRTSRGIEKRLEAHVVAAQQVLNYRRSALIMMNSNYDHKLVRPLEPIYMGEARTIITHKE